MGGIHVHVYFGGAEILMPKHVLHGTQVGAALQQMSGKTVPEGMWRDIPVNTSPLGIFPDEDEQGYAGKFLASGAGDEDIVFMAALDIYMFPHSEPYPKFLYCLGRNGDKAFLVALAADADEPFVQEQVGDLQVGKFADAQAATVQDLDDAMVPDALGLAEVYCAQYVVYFIYAQHLGQLVLHLGRLQQFRGVLHNLLLQNQEAVEGADAAQYACEASGRDSPFTERTGEEIQFFQCYATEVYGIVRIIIEQFLQVLAICVQRIVAVRALEAEILDVVPDNVLRNIAGIGYNRRELMIVVSGHV